MRVKQRIFLQLLKPSKMIACQNFKNFRYFTEYYFALGTENLFILFLNVKPNNNIQESYLK